MGLFELLFAVLKPSNTVFLIALGGFLALLWGWRRLGLSMTGAALALWAMMAYLPLGRVLMMPLEARFPAQSVSALDGIVLLGGFLDTVDVDPLSVTLGDAGERLVATAILAHRFGDAKIFISDVAEAATAAAMLAELGVDPKRIAVEGRATSTAENARYGREVFAPRPDGAYALVTSAWHMPRAVGVFRVAGWPEMVPVPVDPVVPPEGVWSDLPLRAAKGLAEMDWAAREWLALISYRLSGRTDALLPAPR